MFKLTDIKEIRKKKKIRQNALARRIGITTTYLYKIESGRVTNISYTLLTQILSELGVGLTVINYTT